MLVHTTEAVSMMYSFEKRAGYGKTICKRAHLSKQSCSIEIQLLVVYSMESHLCLSNHCNLKPRSLTKRKT